jgi:hypothetical protein
MTAYHLDRGYYSPPEAAEAAMNHVELHRWREFREAVFLFEAARFWVRLSLVYALMRGKVVAR